MDKFRKSLIFLICFLCSKGECEFVKLYCILRESCIIINNKVNGFIFVIKNSIFKIVL